MIAIFRDKKGFTKTLDIPNNPSPIWNFPCLSGQEILFYRSHMEHICGIDVVIYTEKEF